MKVIHLRKNVVNIQKCLVGGDSGDLKRNCGRHCLVPVPGTRTALVVKIGLSEPTKIAGVFFVDDSVVVFETRDRTTNSCSRVDSRNLRILPAVRYARTVSVCVVFDDITPVVNGDKHRDRLAKLVKEILKLYVFAVDSVVFLRNLSNVQRSGLHCLDIRGIDGKKCRSDSFVYTVNRDTKIDFAGACVSKIRYEQVMQRGAELKLGGLSDVRERLISAVTLSRETCQHVRHSNKVLLMGPSGCGKSALVQSVARETGFTLLRMSLPEICSSVSGGTERQMSSFFDKAKMLAAINEDCMILVEDVEVVCMKRRDDTTLNVRRNANKFAKLVEEMHDQRGIFVVATTTQPEDVDPDLRRYGRFDVELEIVPPSEGDRNEIVSNILQYLKVDCRKEIAEKVSLWTPGFVGADLYMAVQEGLLLYRKSKGSLTELDDEVLEECFKKAVSNMTPTSLKGSTGLRATRDADFSHIGGLDDVKKLLDFSVTKQLHHPESFARLGIPLTKGILLYGPPGCAKTTLVRALAKESNTTFLAVSSADLYSPFVGDPEKKILRLFSRARLGAPSIIFIDEIDGLVGSKSAGERSRGVQERVLSALLVEMDGVGTRASAARGSCGAVVVVGATNRPELLDDALKRPGRFDKVVYVPPPDEPARLSILKKLTANMPLHSVDLRRLAEVTENFSGADLKALCYESALVALAESEMTATSVRASHFDKVLAKLRPSLTPDMIRSYESFRDKTR